MFRLLALIVIATVSVSSGAGAQIFPRNSQWKYFKGLSEASTPDAAAWRAVNFDDTAWATGTSPFYYGEPLTGTQLADMRGTYTSVFFRKVFSVPDPAAISALELETLSDDGFIVWINGREVARYNMASGNPPFSGTSLPALAEPIPFETHLIQNPRDFLVAGNNVIAVQAFNASLADSSDFVFNASLNALVDQTIPVVASIIPADRALVRTLNTIEILFDEAVTGVDAADLLINNEPATNVTTFGAAQYVFEFPEPATGTVQVAWIANPGIQDLSPAANVFVGGGSWSYNFDPDAPLPGLIISEFMADNDDTLNDENGDSSDWIELFNSDSAPVDLNGWFLTDTTNNLTKWRIPNVSLADNSYLVIFASEKNRTNPAAKLHTNFKLSNNAGGHLLLVDPRTNIVSAFINYTNQLEDISYGRERSNPTLEGFFPIPTPGAPNTPGGPGFAPDVQFSRTSGTFTGTFALALSTPSPNTLIRYVLGTNLPTETSPVYSGPINIANTVQVRARAFEPGLLPGNPRSEIFFALAGPVVNTISDLPMIILHNYGAGAVSATTDQFVMMEVFEPRNGVASLTNAPDQTVRARFKRRGSSTQNYAKWSFAFEAWDEYGDDQKFSFLGMPAESDWVFYAPNNFEPVLIHNPFIYQLSRDIGQYATRTRFAELYLNTAGGSIQQANYFGIYVIEEKIKRGSDRVDVDKLEPEHLAAPEVSGGYLLKIDRADPGDSPFSAAGQSINYVDPKGPIIRTAARDPQEKYIVGYFNQFGTALNGANYRDPVNGYARYADVPSWIDHHVLNVLAFNVDALRLSTYFYKPRNGKITFGPIWDFDRALGSTDGRDQNPRVWAASGGTDFFNYPWWQRMFSDSDFWQKWIDRWQELRRDQFSLTNMNRLIDEFSNQVRKAQPREQARWGVTPRGGSYQAEVNLMKTYLKNRAEFIDSQLVGYVTNSVTPGYVPAGTVITLQGPPGATIYYTLNGSDPRASGGGVAAAAQIYTAPITVPNNIRLFARAQNPLHSNLTGALRPVISSTWSGVTIGTYATQVPQLTITEIMYNPAGPPSGIQYTNQDYEYIELKNIGTTPINLAGAEIKEGISFLFTGGTLNPGEQVLVVKSRAVFESRYGTGLPIAGEYTGNLDNAGERIVLLGPLKEPIVDFIYDDGWYPMTDGLGFSLVLASENAAFNTYSLKTTWAQSATVNGSPGTIDPARPIFPTVWVNEALTHTDLPAVDTVELFNPGPAAADISGWYLSDDFSAPKKYQFPGGTRVDAGDYQIFDENVFNVGPNSFSFSSKGEEVYIFSADPAGNLTGYYHGYNFGAAANGVTFGRHVSSDNREHFTAQLAGTLAQPNSGPRIGPVIISEILYFPPMAGTNDNVMDEFIELQNISSQAIDLFHPQIMTNTWRLRGGSDFEFPQGVAIPPGGYVLLVNFDPSTNQVTTDAFRTRYGLAGTVGLFGPYRGKLNNTGERLALQRPDTPDLNDGDVPYIVVDEVSYASAAPWPATASGTGRSIQRKPATFADDPASWIADDPTAAAPTPGSDDPDPDRDGLPTDWEIANSLDPDSSAGDNGANGDLDRDGRTNLEEYISGTFANDPRSYLRFTAISVSAGSPTLEFERVTGKTYSIFYRADLSTGTWQKLTDINASGPTGPVQFPDPASNSTRFYRLVTPQQP